MSRLLRVAVLVLSVSLVALAVRIAQRAGTEGLPPAPLGVPDSEVARAEDDVLHYLQVDLSTPLPEPAAEALYLGGLKSDMMFGIGGLIGGKGTQIGSRGLGARGSGLSAPPPDPAE